ncbi:MAG TPA: ribonuclease HII [Steroidobacteraceae bacterium]|nr:ribonuclease HII [Steroidobacteraceae bacterium]
MPTLLERLIAGVDEAGRGPLAGPVVAAAVILDPRRPIRGLKDSKQLDAQTREVLAVRIRERALSWAVGWAEPEEIDALNILEATHLAMRRALMGLAVHPRRILVDGNRLPRLSDLLPACAARAIIRGDCTQPAISAASILAKTYRDAVMQRLDVVYPGYGLAAHKGYCTADHLAALLRQAACAIHRRSFRPVTAPWEPVVLEVESDPT